MPVLVVNPGSTSLKLRVLDDHDRLVVDRDVTVATGDDQRARLAELLDQGPPPRAAGVRVVHGGADFLSSVLVDDDVASRLVSLNELAPLHNPPALGAIDALRSLRPELPVVACFDSAFHATLPPAAATYAVPWEWTAEWGLRRYGFHGLSHAYASRRAAELVGQDRERMRVVTCHLGGGASLAAVAGGVSVDTTMGFTPMEGLMMATRAGSVDVGLVLWAMRHRGLSVDEMEDVLERRSGLLGVAGDADMQAVVAGRDRGDERCRVAFDVYVHRARAGVAAMVAAMGGVDALVFTGGVGEHSAVVRREACAGLGFLGVGVDEAANERVAGGQDADVSAPGAAVTTLVVAAREDLEIAREVRRLVPL